MKYARSKFLPAAVKPGRFFVGAAVIGCLAMVLLAGAGILGAQSAPRKGAQPVDKRIGDLEKDVLRLQRQADIFNLDAMPDNLVLCVKKVPIFRGDIRERFERELFQLLENRGLLTIVIKRYYKYLPMMSEEVNRAGVPADLVYVAVTESYLNPRAVSRASAGGMWQFMKETGKMEGLVVNDTVDERYNMKRSTRSALAHLKKLNGQLGDWLLAMSAYNAGPGRVREAIDNQSTRDFFDMYLPEETERYVFRILALKEIIANKERYGFRIEDKELYRPALFSEVVIEAGRDFDSGILAKGMDVSYRTYRLNNLHLKKYRLPKGIYRVNVPAERKDSFIKKMRSYNYIQCQ